ncbi:MAG: putative monovalent cation/H+ antiporter subunit A [Pseudomonadota bacterium]
MDVTFLAFFLPFIAAALAPKIIRIMGHNGAWVLALFPAFLFVHWTGFLPEIAAGERATGGYHWIPSFNVNFSWFIDGLSLVFALLITGIGTLVVLYAGGYMKGHPMHGRFLSFILMFMGAMQGLVLADSFLMFFVFWELTSITSFLLIGFKHDAEKSRRSATQALVVTGTGGLILLAGLIVLWNITGFSEFSLLLNTGDAVRESAFYMAALILVLGGCFTKSAQFPLHFWLPNAMEAPTPVSAYLHSATMVKAGVYLLMRLNPVLGETVAWETILPLFGGVTLLVGTVLAVRQSDLKLMLAYTTVASLGLLVMLTGFGTHKAIEGAVLYLIAHSLFKGALFMVAGNVDHETGTRDVARLGGLMSLMPLTFGAAIFSAISMGGLPPMTGFLAKEELYYGVATSTEPWVLLVTATAIIGNALMFVIGFVVALKPFFGAKTETPKDAHEAPVLMLLGPLVLAAASLMSGVLSPAYHAFLSSPMASAVIGEAVTIKISLLPKPGIALYLSILTVFIGVVLYLAVDRIRNGLVAVINFWGPDRGFDQLMAGIVRGSTAITRVIQSGRMEVYLTLTFALFSAFVLGTMARHNEWPDIPGFPDMFIYEWAIVLIAAIGIIAVVWAKDRLTAIVSLGIQGFAVAVIFMLNGAPDLSFTQFMVETLSVVVLALVMTRLRLSPADHRSWTQVLIDGTISVAAGLAFCLVLLGVLQTTFDPTLSEFFNRYSYTIAQGKNIVNVILVDFRGVDTFGEIAVVMVSGLAILALIRVVPKGRRKAALANINNSGEDE